MGPPVDAPVSELAPATGESGAEPDRFDRQLAAAALTRLGPDLLPDWLTVWSTLREAARAGVAREVARRPEPERKDLRDSLRGIASDADEELAAVARSFSELLATPR